MVTRYLRTASVKEPFWRSKRKRDWYVTEKQQERSPTGYVGIKNIGCICYMISIMQQLFMIPGFRKALLEIEDERKEDESENMLF